MSSPARATITLAAGSAVALTAGVISAKIVALVAGPGGVGTVGLLASLLGLGAIVAGLGVGVGLIRQISTALVAHDEAAIGRVRTASRVVGLLGSGVMAIMLVLGRDVVASYLFGESGRGWEVALIGIAIVFNVMAGVETSAVNGFHRVPILAAMTAGAAVGMAVGMVLSVAGLGISGVAPGLLSGAIAGWSVSMIGSSLLPARMDAGPATPGMGQAVLGLVRFGVPFMASQLVGTGAQLMIPFVILGFLGTADVGYFRAASSISIAYLAFLLNAMAQDYYPRLAAIVDADALAETVRDQLRFVLAISIPLILVTSAFAPLVIHLLYSADFASAADVLRWQLIGDLVKLPSWTISFVILARGRSSTFLATETIAGIALIAFTVVGVQVVGLVGAGVAYLATYLVYYPVVAFAARRQLRPRFDRPELAVAGLVVTLVTIQLARPSLPDWAPTTALLAMAGGTALAGWTMTLRRRKRGRPR